MGSSVRRRPNCFNLLFQMRVVQRMKKDDIAGLEAGSIMFHINIFLVGLKYERPGTRPAPWPMPTKSDGWSRHQLGSC